MSHLITFELGHPRFLHIRVFVDIASLVKYLEIE